MTYPPFPIDHAFLDEGYAEMSTRVTQQMNAKYIP